MQKLDNSCRPKQQRRRIPRHVVPTQAVEFFNFLNVYGERERLLTHARDAPETDAVGGWLRPKKSYDGSITQCVTKWLNPANVNNRVITERASVLRWWRYRP